MSHFLGLHLIFVRQEAPTEVERSFGDEDSGCA
jgi:hypothetical protein